MRSAWQDLTERSKIPYNLNGESDPAHIGMSDHTARSERREIFTRRKHRGRQILKNEQTNPMGGSATSIATVCHSNHWADIYDKLTGGPNPKPNPPWAPPKPLQSFRQVLRRAIDPIDRRVTCRVLKDGQVTPCEARGKT
jgi:hypothetical protein